MRAKIRIHSAKELALTIADRRQELGLSQKETGALVGLLQKTISAFETKPDSTKLGTLFRILASVSLDLQLVPREKTIKTDTWKEEW